MTRRALRPDERDEDGADELAASSPLEDEISSLAREAAADRSTPDTPDDQLRIAVATVIGALPHLDHELALGGNAYGYDITKVGERAIKEAEAAVVRRIFREFAAGKSPRAIAKALNAEGIPGPGGRPLIDTTIRGQRERGTGVLNNDAYADRLVWNRVAYLKDPRTGRRKARPNPPGNGRSLRCHICA